jgi:hypothetical protein
LTVDAFGGGALIVDLVVEIAVAINLVALTGAYTRIQIGETAAFSPPLVIHRADIRRPLGILKWAGIAALLMRDQRPARCISMLERYGQAHFAERRPSVSKVRLGPRLVQGTAAKTDCQGSPSRWSVRRRTSNQIRHPGCQTGGETLSGVPYIFALLNFVAYNENIQNL